MTRNLKVCMIHSDRGGIKTYSEYLKEYLKCDTFIWPVKGLLNRVIEPIKQFKKLKELLNKYDIVHVQYHFSEYLCLFLPLLFSIKRKAKIILTLHEDYKYLPKIFRSFHNYFYKFADLLIVHTQDHFDMIPSNNKQIIHHGVRTDKIKRNPIKGQIILPGFVNPWKGHHVLLEAVKGMEYHLIIWGKSNNKGYMDRLIQIKPPNVAILDEYVSNRIMRCKLDECEFAVLPHTRITASGILCELINAEIPTLLSDIPSFKYQTYDKATYFKSGDVKDLKDKLETFREKIPQIQKLFKEIKRKDSWTVISKLHLRAYNLVMEHQKGSSPHSQEIAVQGIKEVKNEERFKK